MKKGVTTILVVILLATVAYGQQQNVSPEKGQPSGLPSVGLQGNVDAIREHIKAGSDLNVKDAYGPTPLIVAVTFDKTEAVKALIETGADLEIRNNDGSTPLHIAAFFCRTEIVKALLDNGADKNTRNIFGNTALESVTAPFEKVKGFYDNIGAVLGPMGLKLDYERIKMTRPKIAAMLGS